MRGKKERVRQERKENVLINGEEVRGNYKGGLKELKKNNDQVAESKLERYSGHMVNLSGKENLHPGDGCIASKSMEEAYKEDLLMEGDVDDPNDPFQISVDDVCLATKVAGSSRGAASKGFTVVLRDMKRRYKLDVVVILEPRISGALANRTVKSWGFKHSVRREAEGFLGGIWVLWSLDDLIVDVLALEEQFIHWSKWEGLERVYKRLDRCLCNVEWQAHFPNAVFKVVLRVCSDHHPLVVCVEAESKSCRAKPFRYEVAWQLHEEYGKLVEESWKGEEDVNCKLSHLQHNLVR
ncbi:hypothetical protein K1719_038973 [Acacia pycnantha]|nr:hypothetical protein K1719_038973 [Acacia pycnantha]